MSNSPAAPFVLDTRLLKAGAALASAGLLLATVGMGIAGLTVRRAARDWLAQHEVSPSALAAEKVRQVRHATTAGAHAWREYPQAVGNGVVR
jgi:hypothetical protein